jgi:retinol-binding protein 3
MKNLLITIIILILNIAYAQKNITVEKQKAIVEKLSNEISKYYFNEKIAESVADTLMVIKAQIKKETTLEYFTNDINTILNKISNDNHLKVYFDSIKFSSYHESNEAKINFEYKAAQKINFGFTKVEILDGNIGYIDIVKFSGFIQQEVAQKIASVMNLVESTNALIIDLRKNGGGDGRVGDILATYFFPEENEVFYDSISRTEKFKVLSFVVGKRYLDRPVYILTGPNTFSAAEGFTNFMQVNKKAVVIGEKTKGGGSAGNSVPLIDGFLCFIPTSFLKSDSNASVTPDFACNEKNALIYAKYLFYQEKLTEETNQEAKELLKWNIKTSEYLLNKIDNKFNLSKRLTGNFESGRRIVLKDNQLFLTIDKNDYKLVQLDEKEFLIEGFESMFGTGNRRVILNETGFLEVIYFNGQFLNKFWKKI